MKLAIAEKSEIVYRQISKLKEFLCISVDCGCIRVCLVLSSLLAFVSHRVSQFVVVFGQLTAL